MEINRFRWANEEAQSDIELIWKQVGKEIVNSLMKKMLADKNQYPFLGDEETFAFEADWSCPDDWTIKTFSKKIYNSGGNYIENEKLLFISGRLFIVRFNVIKMEPSFGFEVNVKKKTLFFEASLVKRIMKTAIEKEDKSAIHQLGSDVFSKSLTMGEGRELPPGMERDLRSAFKSLGFSKDEINLMVHNTLTHESFQDGMELGQLVRLGLDSADTI